MGVAETHEVRRQEAAIRGFGRLTQHRYQTPKPGSANLPCKVCGLRYEAEEHKMPKAKDALAPIPLGGAKDDRLSDKCTQCNGNGKKWFAGQLRFCPSCNGSGKEKNAYVAHDSARRLLRDFVKKVSAKDSNDWHGYKWAVVEVSKCLGIEKLRAHEQVMNWLTVHKGSSWEDAVKALCGQVKVYDSARRLLKDFARKYA